jgi:hypothetical protein
MWKKRVMIKGRKFYPAITISEFYKLPKDNLDVLFIGSSRAYSSFIPQLFDSITKLNSYNLGTSSQSPITSFFLLKEVYKYQHPKVVFIDISHEIIANSKSEGLNGGYVFDHLLWSDNKLSFFMEGYQFKDKINYFFPSYRYRNNFNWLLRKLIFNNGDIKDDGKCWYKGGYVGSIKNISSEDIKEPINLTFDPKLINKRRLIYLNKMIDLARTYDSKVVFVYNPYPKVVLERIEDRTIFFGFYSNIAKSLNVDFININNERILLKDTIDFRDMNHLNHFGAKKVTDYIAHRVLAGDL